MGFAPGSLLLQRLTIKNHPVLPLLVKCPLRLSKIILLPSPLPPGSHKPVTSMQEMSTTPIISAGSRSLMTTQDKSSTTGQPLSSGRQLSKPSVIPPPVKSRGSNPKNDVYLMRRIIAEDAEWSLAIVPLLTELCIQHIVKNFQSESVPAWSGKETARNGARWVGSAWRRGLRGWVLGSPYPPHTASSSPLNTSLCPCSQGRFCCYAHFQAPPDSCPHCALHVCALSSHVPLSPAKPRPHFVYLFLQKALPGWLTSTLLESSLACIGFWFVLYSVLCKCSSFLKTSCQPLLLSGSSLKTSTPSLSTAPITIQL